MKVSLKDVTILVNEKIDSKLADEKYYVTTENMLPNRGGVSFPAQSFTTAKRVNIYNKSDILVSNIRPYFKKIWFANHGGTRSGDILTFRSKDKSRLSQEYLYMILQSDAFFDYVTKTSKGTKMPRGDKKAIMNFKIDLPPIDEQLKKAESVLTIERKIKLNRQINANLLTYSMELFKSYFPKEKYFNVSNGKALYDYAEFINGTSFKKKEYADAGIPIIKIAELKNGITDNTQYFDGKKDHKYDVKNGDILFSWSGNPQTSIDTFVWHNGDGILNQHTFNVHAYNDHKWFIFILLKVFKPIFTSIAKNKQTTGLGHVTQKDLKRLTFKEDKNEILSFERIIDPLMEMYYSNLKQNQILSQIKNRITFKLLN